MYDFIGDVHGCIEELKALLETLGYFQGGSKLYGHPEGRKVVFVGDLNDRGPNSVATLALGMYMCKEGSALAVTGNHDDKLRRALKPGSKVEPKHGLAETLKELSQTSPEFRAELAEWLETLPYRLLLDDGKVIVAHAGLPAKMHINPYEEGKNGKTRAHALYGDVDGKVDANNLPIRKDWTKDYSGERVVVHGHVPVREPDIRNKVYNIDTGCCFGGKLTALRYPEMTFVSVPALKVYCEKKEW
jgi:protein phosphatase